jgi:cbb3-type cytochrome oxidase subunit 3
MHAFKKLFIVVFLGHIFASVFSQEVLPDDVEGNNIDTQPTDSITSSSAPPSGAISASFPSSSPINSSTVPTSTISHAVSAATVQGAGWNSNGNDPNSNHESWLKEHNRFIFIIFLGLLFLGLIGWYIYRSVKGMRKRLEQENQSQLDMIQQISPHPDHLNSPMHASPPPTYKTQI